MNPPDSEPRPHPASTAIPLASGCEAVYLMQARDPAGLKLFFQDLGPALMGVALRMLHNREEAEEALQDTLVRCWDKAETFDAARGRAFTWAVTILRGFCLDRLRKAGRRVQLVALPEGMDPAAPLVFHLGDESDIKAALFSLTEKERETLEMVIFGDLTHPEISTATAEPLGTIKSRIRRSLLKIQAFLNPDASPSTLA